MTTLTLSDNGFQQLSTAAKKMHVSIEELVEACAKYMEYTEEDELEILPFIPQPTESIIAEFRKTQKYNEAFLQQLEEALNDSVVNNTRK